MITKNQFLAFVFLGYGLVFFTTSLIGIFLHVSIGFVASLLILWFVYICLSLYTFDKS